MKAFFYVSVFFFLGCSSKHISKNDLFTNVTLESGIKFQNTLSITEKINPYTFRNFYNGAGVAIGDINNDGLLDIYFASNQAGNKLYLNKGNLHFEDITDQAGVACANVWSSGVTMVDINADGLLDIYVCKSGDPDAPYRYNELFINNGDLTFTEKSKEYGLDIKGLSVQAAFFDFDKDGDLDCYLLTNSIRSVGNYDLVKEQRKIPDPKNEGNKFFINDNGKFHDYSEQSGIYRSSIGFGLGITLGDFNNDSWTDIFVSNDFFERDYLYINNQHGAFTESLTDYFHSISMGSMGADFADVDNDGQPELFVTEMLPDSLSRKKTKTIFENWNKYQLNLENGYYHQFSRNVLQRKIGINNYAEIGRLAGVAASEWSWGALIFDMDNDGQRDIFIANGIYKDLLDRDYLAYTAAEDNVRKIIKDEKNAILKLIALMPSSKFPNYAYRNKGNLKFENVASEWGLGEPMFSSGSAYGDLDNDGDLDLVLNNINSPAAIFRNNTDSTVFKNLSITLKESSHNRLAVGAQVTAYRGGKKYFSDNFVTRGFQSSVQQRISLGLGVGAQSVDSLFIQWPESEFSRFYNVSVNKHLVILKDSVKVLKGSPKSGISALTNSLDLISNKLFRHKASGLIDFNRDRLLPMMYCNETPSIQKADINGDGFDEIYLGGGKDQSSVFVEYQSGKFVLVGSKELDKYKLAEETKGAFFDADGDGDQDFYMATGGRFFPKSSTVMLDHLFLNNGKGEFKESLSALPFTDFFSTSVVKPIDIDKDGDLDLFVGDRGDTFSYGLGGRAYLLENNGKGIFTDVTKQRAPSLLNVGMVTDAVATDFDGDGWQDILVVGDWMPIVFLRNKNGHFANVAGDYGLTATEGWWHTIESGDLNNDGKPDFVLGNHGLNSFFKSGDRAYVNDFDRNGSAEQLFCTKIGEKYFPVVDKDELVSQLPALRKSLLYYKDYAKKSIDELFPSSILNNSKILEVKLLSSIMLLSNEHGFTRVDLPLEAQYSPIYSLLIFDYDLDGIQDVIAGGNQFEVKPQFGRYDGSSGWFFKGELKGGKYSLLPGADLNVQGEIRDIETLTIDKTRYILFAKYDDELEVYKIPK